MKRDNVVLVNRQDHAIGEMDKMEAHLKGALHRAFSILIFNSKGEMLLQKRGKQKYHGAGLWTNTCCSHHQLGENVKQSARERLMFEMGLSCELDFLFSFVYRSKVENNLIEHEFDHVFIGYSDLQPKPNIMEVEDFKWISRKDLRTEIEKHPEQFTCWFREIVAKIWDNISAVYSL